MNRSSFSFSQCWRVILALCVLLPLGVPTVRAQEKKSAQLKPEKALAGSMARMLRIHDPNVRALMREAIRRTGIMISPILSRDGKTLIYRDGDYRTHGLRIERGVVRPISFPPRNSKIDLSKFDPDQVDSLFAAFSPDKRLFACSRPIEENGRQLFTAVSLFDTRTWKVVRVLRPQSNTIRSIAFSADEKRVLVGSAGGGATIYDVANGRALAQWHYKNNFKGLVVAFAQTPEGEKAVALTVSWDIFAYSDVPEAEQRAGAAEPSQLWDIQTNQKLADFPELAGVRGAAFNSNGSQVAMMGVDPASQIGKQSVCEIVVAQWQLPPSFDSRRFLPIGTILFLASPLWTLDDETVLAVAVGYGDNWFQVFDNPLPAPSKP